jgi:hypothetical protein
LKNDDFWKSQFAKHDVSSTGNPPITPASPKPPSNSASVETKTVSATEEPSTSTVEKTIQPIRLTQSTPSSEQPVPLSRFPAKTKTQWEQWLLNRKVVPMKK